MTIFLYCLGGLGALVLCLTLYTLIRKIFFSGEKIVKRNRMDEWLIETFETCNVIVFGKQRRGKDLLFSHVIELIGRDHYSNITYNSRTELIDIAEINLGDNKYEDLMNGTIEKIPCRFKEGGHIYISDGGVYLSNDYDSELNRKYPTLPMFMALSAQIFGLHVHINSQAVGRPYKKARDQAECFIQCLGTTRRGDCLYIDIVVYDKLRNAENETNWILRGQVCVPLAEIHYDTRFFRSVFIEDEPESYERGLSHIGELKHIGGINHVG